MMKCFVDNNENAKAILLYEEYNGSPDDVTDLLFIKACGNIGDYEKAKKVIDDIPDINKRCIQFLTNLIDFYGKNAALNDALKVFNNIAPKKKNIISINTMMKCFMDHNEYEKVISLYDEFAQYAQLQPTDVTNLTFIRACSNVGDYEKAKKVINALDIVNNVNQHSIQFLTNLIDFYAKTGELQNALNIFNNIPAKKINIIAIHTMMKCFIDHNENGKAILLYEEIVNNGYGDTDIANVLFIKACGNIGYYDKCLKLINSVSNNINNQSIEVVTTVIDYYGKTGDIHNALNIFHNIPQNKKDIACIGAMMNAYNNNEQYCESLDLFNQTKRNGITMHEYVYCAALIAAGNLVSPHQGNVIIADLQQDENMHILKSLYVQSAIILMHAKCSNFGAAITIFTNNMDKGQGHRDRNGMLHLYNAMMDCYAKTGNIKELLSLFHTLKRDEKVKMTEAMYCIVLNGCSHSGLVDEAMSIFEDIVAEFENNMSSNVVTAFIDCLARKGNHYLAQAENVYDTYIGNNIHMYYKCKLHALFSLLSACRIHNDMRRSERIFDKINMILKQHEIKDIDNDTAASMHVLLSNIYGQNKDFEKVDKIRKIMKEKKIRKKAGMSWIEIDGETHTFLANDKSHPMHNEIAKEREILKNELKNYGHVFDANVITRELNENENVEDHLCGHSEKSALIYGLIMTSPETPLVIAKNLRVCKNCHSATKLISKIRKRKLSVRDKNRWHIFENGQCSCNDYF